MVVVFLLLLVYEVLLKGSEDYFVAENHVPFKNSVKEKVV